ncbi:MAG TPA: cbb3-type cytochrome oxidase assembly protein CcoS [Polyangiaceae bacterium]
MSIIFLILPITLLLSLAAVAAFTWATRRGQFDDVQTPAVRALHDTHLDSSREENDNRRC